MVPPKVPVEDTQPNPHALLTREVLQAALKSDLGSEWTLQDFEIKDFTKKGDNYICAVTSVSCTAVSNGSKKETYYVAKLNPLREMTIMDEMLTEVYIREGTFLTDIAIKLNQILSNISHTNVKFPECVYYSFTKGREVLLSRDLRKKGYRMIDNKVGMDTNHAELLVKELAKLHSSSYLLKIKLQEKGMLRLYPFLKENIFEPSHGMRTVFRGIIRKCIETSLNFLREIDGYEEHQEWLERLKDNALDIYARMILESEEQMRVICHGDCWNNNVVFRYDADGNPVQITLLDLQVCRLGSVGLDLNFFFYTSITGDVRKKYLNNFLDVYFKEFQKVFEAADEKMPFDMDQLRREVREKLPYGIISGLMATPFIMNEGEDSFDFNDIKDGEDIEAGMKSLSDTSANMIDTNPIFKSRFLAVLDDAKEIGFFS